MRFMCMHKVDATMESGARPSHEIIQKMGQLIGRSLKAGIFKDGAGLHRSAERARVTFGKSGAPSVKRGPYAGENELITRFAMITLPASGGGLDKAIELGTELGKAAGDREVEIGPLVEGWDLNGGARPTDAPFRYLLLLKADGAYEAGAAEPAAVRTLLDRWASEGVLQSEASLRPSKAGARTKVTGGKRQWIDGPFTESKELIAGFSVLELPSMDEAKRFTDEYVAILGDNECDIREVV